MAAVTTWALSVKMRAEAVSVCSSRRSSAIRLSNRPSDASASPIVASSDSTSGAGAAAASRFSCVSACRRNCDTFSIQTAASWPVAR